MSKEFNEDLHILGGLTGHGTNDILSVTAHAKKIPIIDKDGVVVGYLPLTGGTLTGDLFGPNNTGIYALPKGGTVPSTMPFGTLLVEYESLPGAVSRYFNPQPPSPFPLSTLHRYKTGAWTDPAHWALTSSASLGWTNWDDGLEKLNAAGGDIAIFITDGTPTAFNFDHPGDPFNTIAVATGMGEARVPTEARALAEASAIAAQRHLLVIGVGDAMRGFVPGDTHARPPTTDHFDPVLAASTVALMKSLSPNFPHILATASGNELARNTPLDIGLLQIDNVADVPAVLHALGINATTLGARDYSIMIDASDSLSAAHQVAIREGVLSFLRLLDGTGSTVALGQFGTAAEMLTGRLRTARQGEFNGIGTVWKDPSTL